MNNFANVIPESIEQHEGKPQLSNLLYFRNALTEISKVREFGMTKYPDPESYKKIPNSMLTDALMRHLFNEVDESIDEESNCEHLAHLALNAIFLLEKRLSAQKGK